MKLKTKNILPVVFFTLSLAALFNSCSSELTIKANNDLSTNINFNLSLGKVITQTITEITSGMSMISGQETQEVQIFSKEEILNSFKGSDFSQVQVNLNSNNAFTVSGKIPPVTEQKVTPENSYLKIANFITCKNNSLTLILSPQSVRTVISTLPQSTQSYMDLLMAPVFMEDQEPMTPQEYLELVGSVYGENIAAELQKGVIKVSLECPSGAAIKKTSLSETKSTINHTDKVVFTLPLTDLLTMTETKTFSIIW